MTLVIVTFPAPLSVKRKPPLFTLPLSVNVPESELIVLAEPKVIAPAKLLLPLIFRNAPSLAMPEPFNVSVSVPTAMPP